MRRRQPFARITACLILVFSIMLVTGFSSTVLAKMYIHLNNGEIVTLPYSRSDVLKITYSGSKGTSVPPLSHSDVAEPDYGEARTVRTGRVTLTSHNYPNHAIRHRGFMGELTEIRTELDQQDATFKIVRGLADPAAISFESVNYPGYYLRHQGYRIKLHKNDGSGLFQADATFKRVPGLADPTKYSFQSVNYPTHYIRHRGFMLYIEQGNGDLYQNDCTFTIGPPAWRK